MRLHRRFSKRAIAVSVGLLCGTGPFVGRAYADMQNGTFYSGSAFFKESHRDEGNGLVGLWDVEVRRVLQFKNVWEQICDYQAEVKITLPQGKVFDDLSSLHEGCNPNGGPAWFTFPQFGDKENHDNWPKGSLIEAYWKDNHTGGEFRKIGSQKL
jgi:hypothetical protein